MPGRGTEPGAELYPECGTREGMLRHRREKTRNCAACREFNRQAMARYRVQRIIAGRRMVPTLGTRRRVRALARRGWRQVDLAERLGMTWQAFAKVLQQAETHRETAEKVAALYRELWDQNGPSPLIARRAKKWGWPGPADWDDPDNPDEVPVCVIEAAHAEAKEIDRLRRKNLARRQARRDPGGQVIELRRQGGRSAPTPTKAAMAT